MLNSNVEDRWIDCPLEDEDSLNEIQSEWEEESSVDGFQAEMGLIFSGIAEDLKRKDISTEYISLVENNTVRAILGLSDAAPGGRVKVLSLYLSPTYWDSPTCAMLTDLYCAVLIALSDFVMIHARRSIMDSSEVRIYGRDREVLDILRTLNNNWTPEPPLELSMIGRWLSVAINRL